MITPIHTLELAAWDLDAYEFRPERFDREQPARAREVVARRQPYKGINALCEEETLLLRDVLERQLSRSDLQAEMLGLDWHLGVVDVRHLLAFQRRLSFNPTLPALPVPQQSDWTSLINIAFASLNPVTCDAIHDIVDNTITLRSGNPNLHLRVSEDAASLITVHAGSPFLEIGCYLGRWFLRDGYHRAYALLRAGIFQLPAIIVKARTIEELGAVKPHFFSEAVLLSEQPPFVTDFLDDSLTIEYDRPPTIKTLHITMEESIAIATHKEISGEQL